MPERELHDWQLYAARRMLPSRRLELLLAQISMLIAATMGGVKNAQLGDYLFDPKDEAPSDDAPDSDVDDFAALFGAARVKD